MRSISVWLDKLLHPVSEDEVQILRPAGLCKYCARWNFPALFAGKNYPARYYGPIKDTNRYFLWDVRSLKRLRAAKTCPACTFFVGLLVDRGQLRQDGTTASERHLTVEFEKRQLSKCCGMLYLRVASRQAIQGSHHDSSSDDDEGVSSGGKWIIVLPELGSMLAGELLTDYPWGGKRVAPYCNFAEISSWIRVCSTDQGRGTHFGCAGKGRFDTYTLDTLRFIDVNAMCLIVKQLPEQYAALSYVWGPPDLDHMKLYQEDVETMSKHKALRERWNRVPTTIKDAIKVCIECDIPYLWVDALCLIQNAPDLSLHLDKMTEIYDAAVMTIVAACGNSSWTGLSGVSKARPRSQKRVPIGSMGLIEALPPLGVELEKTRWTQRGWTFQEHIFSKRCLIFLENRVVFQCNRGWIDESIDFDYCGRRLSEAKASTRLSLPAEKDEFYFLDFVECFCKLELTYDSDTLNACKGTMAWFERNGTRFFWATPTNNMLGGLDFEAEGLKRRVDYPTWSWLGWGRPNTQEKRYQKFSKSQGANVRSEALCKIDIPSLNSNYTTELPRFTTLQLSVGEWDKLLALKAPVTDPSNLEGALSFSHDEDANIRPLCPVHNDHEAWKLELVGLEQEYEVEPYGRPLFVTCLIIKTDARGVSERIGVGRVELPKWQAAEVKERTVYLI
jgi:hypothetical protein